MDVSCSYPPQYFLKVLPLDVPSANGAKLFSKCFCEERKKEKQILEAEGDKRNAILTSIC